MGSSGTTMATPAQAMNSLPDKRETSVDRLKRELNHIDKRKQLLNEAIEQHQASAYKVGDPAVLPEVGVVLVSEVLVPAQNKLDNDMDGLAPSIHRSQSKYSHITDTNKEIHYCVGSPLLYDSALVAESKLLPLNSASKTLYGKK